MSKLVSIEQAVAKLEHGQSLLIGGFLNVGTPERLVDFILEKGLNDLEIIGNDTSFPDKGVGRLVANKRVRKVVATHIGTNPETGKQMHSGETEVVLVPQGTLAEQIRAGGAGLGGVLTPTGIGTVVEEGKEKVTVDGKDFLLEKPIGADVALIKAYKAEKYGNLVYRKAARNFNPIMATAAKLVIAEVDHVVESIDPDEVMTPGVFVDMVVRGDE
ncbi:3-oxoacid CoA-transferase subunit A [Proteinivorax hydrogeniformans]|uniref:3-oxoacid CoA-transferase subunit A n=1 Tax=Proteinivorax hydrogeniformans TaxID=1826727 RepID=A0AAU8HTS9_9FIRM